MTLLLSGGEKWDVGLRQRKQVTGGMSLRVISCLDLFLYFSSLLPVNHKMSSLCHMFTTMIFHFSLDPETEPKTVD
jgi:hypothetical protein